MKYIEIPGMNDSMTIIMNYDDYTHVRMLEIKCDMSIHSENVVYIFFVTVLLATSPGHHDHHAIILRKGSKRLPKTQRTSKNIVSASLKDVTKCPCKTGCLLLLYLYMYNTCVSRICIIDIWWYMCVTVTYGGWWNSIGVPIHYVKLCGSFRAV